MITQKNSLFVTIFTFCALFITSVHAEQAITPQQAGEIQQAFQTKLNQIVQGSNGALRLDGDLLVEPTESYYAVTLPRALIDLTDGQVIDYGITALNLVPGKTADEWMVSMALPTEITTKDKAGELLSTLTIGEQDFSGTWNNSLGWFQKMNSRLGALMIMDTQTKAVVKLAGLSIAGTSEAGLDAKTVNAMGQIAIEGVSATVPENKGTLSIASINMKYDMADVEFSLVDQINKMVEQVKTDEFSVSLEPHFSEIDNHFVLKDLAWTIAGDVDKSFKIASMATKGNYASREEGLIDSETQFDVAGVSTGGDTALTQWLPQEMSAHVQINNFPRHAMSDWIKEQMSIQRTEKDASTKAKLTVPPNVEELKAAFVNAGTEYKITQLNVKTPIGAGFNADAHMTATEGAPYVATGAINLALTGLNLATAALQQKVADMTVAASKEEGQAKDFLTPMIAQQGLMGIMMVQGFGKTETDASGQTVTRFDITLPREGGILLNGQDIGGLMGMLSKGQIQEK